MSPRLLDQIPSLDNMMALIIQEKNMIALAFASWYTENGI